MSEIEKMYENAGIGKRMTCFFECSHKTCSVDCKHFEKLDMSYPPFTAEKQLELIKWCLDNYRGYIFDSIETEWFEEQLCAFINNIWQDLTEEKQQVKGILE